jgi:L-ascorbate metabolism protein UlaG (beta-lactamase superfamily)
MIYKLRFVLDIVLLHCPASSHNMNSATDTTIEWFGATTYRLRTKGLTIFLDTWLERPSTLPVFLRLDDVKEADYIFISHAHFDQ